MARRVHVNRYRFFADWNVNVKKGRVNVKRCIDNEQRNRIIAFEMDFSITYAIMYKEIETT